MVEVEYLWNSWVKKNEGKTNLVLCDWPNFRYPIDFASNPRFNLCLKSVLDYYFARLFIFIESLALDKYAFNLKTMKVTAPQERPLQRSFTPGLWVQFTSTSNQMTVHAKVQIFLIELEFCMVWSFEDTKVFKRAFKSSFAFSLNLKFVRLPMFKILQFKITRFSLISVLSFCQYCDRRITFGKLS